MPAPTDYGTYGGTGTAVAPAPAKVPVKAAPAPYTPYRPPVAAPSTTAYKSAGAGPYSAWGNVPGGEQNLLSDLRNQFESLIGFTKDISTKMLLQMANNHVLTLRDFGQYAGDHGINLSTTPWAMHGLDKDSYASTASIYAVEYKKVTGQDITQEGLQQAFRNPRDMTGGLLSGTQYQQQLMQDANIQKTYGWVKYGMDYSAWQQQKLGMRTELGRNVQDSEASALLQYNTQARGTNIAASARVPQSQPSAPSVGVGQSLIR